MRAFKSAVEGYVNTPPDERKRLPLPKRPTSALLSPLWKVIQRPWKGTFCDEAQLVSKRVGKRNAAIKCLPTDGIACLSGTAAHNKWTAFSGYLDFVQGLPWKSHADFMRTFCGAHADESSPGMTETRLLQRALQQILISRPLDTFAASHLHGLRCMSVCFYLDPFDAGLVDQFTAKYKEENAKAARAGRDHSGQRRQQGKEPSKAMGWAARARAAAMHPLLLWRIPKRERPADKREGRLANERPRVLPRRTTGEDVDQHERAIWLEMLSKDQFLEQNSARIRAALLTYDHCREAYPDEKVGISSVSLKALDIMAEVLRRRDGIDAVRFDGSIPPLKRAAVLRKLETSPPEVPLLITAGSSEYYCHSSKIWLLTQWY